MAGVLWNSYTLLVSLELVGRATVASSFVVVVVVS